MDPAKLKVVDLRAQLSQRGLDAKGNKAVLVERLRKALQEEDASQNQAKSDTNAENACNATQNENHEASTEVPKALQSPKVTGRSSRSSSMTTPTKVATRSTPRTSVTPNAGKQSSPSKAQHTEVPCKVLPTITETDSVEQTTPKEEKRESPPEKLEEKREEKPAINVKTESHSSDRSQDKGKEQDSSTAKKSETNTGVSQVSVIKSPVGSGECISRAVPAVKSEDGTNETEQKLDEPLVKEEKSPKKEVTSVESAPIDEEKLEESTNKTDEPIVKEKVTVKEDVTIEEKVTAKEEEQSIEETCTDAGTDDPSAVEKDDVNIEPVEHDLSSEKLEMNDNNLKDEQADTIDESVEVKDEKHGINENIVENIDMDDAEADVEMKEVVEPNEEKEATEATEAKEAKDVDTNVPKSPEEKAERKDRKRKRSASPLEDRQTSPGPVLVENEPDIDDSALILSWYDSDLNLVIDKDGYFTATPMHNDDFVHTWAGARASYGFLRGKVYYEVKITEYCPVNKQNEKEPHVLRVGWSALGTSMQLGGDKSSFGYDSTGKKSADNAFTEYGEKFGKEDIVGCYFDATSENDIVLSYAVNGKQLEPAFTISKEDFGGKPLFPHILSKNCSFACNFGQEKPWAEQASEEYVSIGNVETEYKVPGPRRPAKKEDCEVIMLCGLPGCGKTFWAMKHAAEHPEKMYNILGLDVLMAKMKDAELDLKENCSDQLEGRMDKCARALEKLIEMAPSRRRNYIIDQTNVYASAQRRKMKNFGGYQRKAVVVVPTEEEFKLRASKHKPVEGKEVADSVLMDMKANFSVPVAGEFFDAISWVEVEEEEGKKLIEKYNKEGKEAGYGQQQTTKRPRIEARHDINRESRDARRDVRDHRDRRGGNYPERNRNPIWRGGGNMNWRERPQRGGGGHIRHGGGGYGPPIPWRGRGIPVLPAHRGLSDRRGGSGDRRSGNDRGGRSAGSRQGGWAPMSNYQGSQQQVWNQPSNWTSGQSQGGGGGGGWNQQSGGWGTQHWGNWKSYGQGSYNQTNYNQQGYGNGNWNSWNQQYYNQYWGQQQQTGQTTTAGGQAVGSSEATIAASSGNSTTGYDYPQEWDGYTQDYASGQNSRQYRSTVSTTQVEQKFFHNK